MQTFQFSMSIVFVYSQLNVRRVLFWTIQFSVSTVSMSRLFYFKQFSLAHKTVLFQVTQFSIRTQFSSIWPIDRALSAATTPGLNKPESDANEEVFRVPQSSSNTGTSPSDCLESYPKHSLWGGILPPCKDAVGVFYSLGRLGQLLHIFYWLKHDSLEIKLL